MRYYCAECVWGDQCICDPYLRWAFFYSAINKKFYFDDFGEQKKSWEELCNSLITETFELQKSFRIAVKCDFGNHCWEYSFPKIKAKNYDRAEYSLVLKKYFDKCTWNINFSALVLEKNNASDNNIDFDYDFNNGLYSLLFEKCFTYLLMEKYKNVECVISKKNSKTEKMQKIQDEFSFKKHLYSGSINIVKRENCDMIVEFLATFIYLELFSTSRMNNNPFQRIDVSHFQPIYISFTNIVCGKCMSRICVCDFNISTHYLITSAIGFFSILRDLTIPTINYKSVGELITFFCSITYGIDFFTQFQLQKISNETIVRFKLKNKIHFATPLNQFWFHDKRSSENKSAFTGYLLYFTQSDKIGLQIKNYVIYDFHISDLFSKTNFKGIGTTISKICSEHNTKKTAFYNYLEICLLYNNKNNQIKFTKPNNFFKCFHSGFIYGEYNTFARDKDIASLKNIFYINESTANIWQLYKNSNFFYFRFVNNDDTIILPRILFLQNENNCRVEKVDRNFLDILFNKKIYVLCDDNDDDDDNNILMSSAKNIATLLYMKDLETIESQKINKFDEGERKYERKSCSVCLFLHSKIYLNTCRHTPYCYSCFWDLLNKVNIIHCPICRSGVNEIVLTVYKKNYFTDEEEVYDYHKCETPNCKNQSNTICKKNQTFKFCTPCYEKWDENKNKTSCYVSY